MPNIYDREQLREFAAAPDTPRLRDDELARVAELAKTNFGVEEPPMKYKGTMSYDDVPRRGRRERLIVLEPILTADAPAPIGPYNQAIRAGGVPLLQRPDSARSRRRARSSRATSPRRRAK